MRRNLSEGVILCYLGDNSPFRLRFKKLNPGPSILSGVDYLMRVAYRVSYTVLRSPPSQKNKGKAK